jgi:hypothetical protein
MSRMLHSGSKGECDTAYTDMVGQVQQYPEYSDYIKKIYDNPQRYSGYVLTTVEGVWWSGWVVVRLVRLEMLETRWKIRLWLGLCSCG